MELPENPFIQETEELPENPFIATPVVTSQPTQAELASRVRFPDSEIEEPGVITALTRGGAGTLASMASFFGADETSEELKAFAAKRPAAYPDVLDIETFGDVPLFIGEKTLENLPNMAAIIAGGGVGHKGSKLLGAGKEAARKFGWLGAASADFTLQAGETKEQLKSIGIDPGFADIVVPAAIKTGLDMVSPLVLLKKAGLGKVIDKKAMDTLSGIDWTAEIGKGVARTAGAEVPTEAAQAFIDIVAKNLHQDKEWNTLSKEDQRDIINAMAAAGATSIALGPLQGIATAKQILAEEESTRVEKIIAELKAERNTEVVEEAITEEIIIEEAAGQTVESLEAELEAIEGSILADEANIETPDFKEARLPSAEATSEQQLTRKLSEDAPAVVKAKEAVTITHSNNPEDVGKTLNEIEVQKGQVYSSGFEAITVEVPENNLGRAHVQIPLEQALAENEIEIQTLKSALGADKNYNSFIHSQIEIRKEQAEAYQREAHAKKTFQEGTRKQLETWIQKFAPELSIILSDGTAGRDIDVTSRRSGIAIGDKGGQAFPLGTQIAVIELNLKQGFKDRKGRVIHNWSEAGSIEPGSALGILAHEFGHTLHRMELEKAPRLVRKVLNKEYLRWLQDIKALPIQEFLAKYRSLPTILRHHNLGENSLEYGTGTVEDYIQESYEVALLRGEGERSAAKQASYLPSYAEYLAENTARWLLQNRKAQNTIELYFDKVARRLAQFFQAGGKELPVSRNYGKYLESLAVRAEIFHMQQAMEEKANSLPKDKQTGDVVADAAAVPGDNILKGLGKDDAEIREIRKKSQPARFNWFIKTFANLTQVSLENPDVPGIAQYTEAIRKWWADKTAWTERADSTLGDWSKVLVNGQEQQAFADMLYEITLKSDDLGRELNYQELDTIMENYKLNRDDVQALMLQIKEDFRETVKALYLVLRTDAARKFADNQTQRDEAFDLYNKEEAKLLNRDFFPLSRFGEHWVHTIAMRSIVMEGISYKAGETVRFEMYESPKAMQTALRISAGRDANLGTSTSGGVMSEESKVYRGMPPELLKMMRDKLDLSEEQRSALDEVLHQIAPGQSYRKHMLNRKGVLGFSKDARRTYADYFLHFSNHISRVENAHLLDEALQILDEHATQKGKLQGQDNIKERGLYNYLKRHQQYAMDPGEEWASVRSAAFIWYLGFNVKSAFVNLTQVPLVTFPYLAARYGDVKTVQYLTRAMKDMSRVWRKGEGMLGSALDNAIQQGIEAGFLNESLATELAGVAGGSNLSRLTPGTLLRSEKGAKILNQASYYAAWMFQKAEQVNRYQTFSAAWQLEVDQQLGKEHTTQGREKALANLPEASRLTLLGEAYLAGRNAIEQTQYEYARWNRPEFMRGRQSVIFLFWQYLQNTLYFAARDPGQVRFMLMMLTMAGMSGLPFAEDLMDLVDFAGTKMKAQLGYKNPKVDIRLEAREFVKELGANPDLVMHGLSRESFGLGHLGEMVGLPIPRVDLSGSLSLGRIIPGVEPVLGREGKIGDRFLEASEDIGGAAISVPLAVVRSLADDNPDTFKRWERSLPSAMKSISRAYRYGTEGVEKTRTGAPIAKFDLTDPVQLLEVVVQGLGAAPSRINQERELRWAQKEHVRYYQTRRTLLMTQYDYALQSKDREAIIKMKKEIRSYNNTVPHPALRLTSSDIAKSQKTRRRNRKLEERNIASQRRSRGLSEQVGRRFE